MRNLRAKTSPASPGPQGPARGRIARGYVLIQAMVSMSVIGMFISLGVDVGVLCTAKSELQRAADAASLAGVAKLQVDDNAGAVAQAMLYAKSNLVNGLTLPDAAIRVTLGNWDSGTFTENATPYNAIRVQTSCTAANGNPVKLFFAQFVGVSTINAGATSISRIDKPSEYGIVGIDRANFGSIGVLAQLKGRIVSNGNVNIGWPLGIAVGVQGEAHSKYGATKRGALAYITGSTDPLDKPLNYPSVKLPAANDNANIAGRLDSWGNFTAIGPVNLPGGTYVVRDLNLVASTSITLAGPVTFYVTRNCNIAGAVTLLGSSNFSAANFKIRVLPGGNVNFLVTLLTPLNMDLYAPDSDILIAVGVYSYKGRLIGKTLDILLPTIGTFTEDVTLDPPLQLTPLLTKVF